MGLGYELAGRHMHLWACQEHTSHPQPLDQAQLSGGTLLSLPISPWPPTPSKGLKSALRKDQNPPPYLS